MDLLYIVDGRYVLERQLAEGGMGQVFQARHVQLGKVFALKMIAPGFAENDLARQRFNDEARLASQISHPNIVSVVDFGEDPLFGAYMVMELVEGTQLVKPGEPLMSIKRALEVLGQVADVLDHIHKHGIIHGDVKAENILIAEEFDGTRRRDVVRLLDFGLAQRHDQRRISVDGTPHYTAPERAQGGLATVATDIYALGVLGFQLLTGSLPFDGTTVEILMAHVHDEPPAVGAVRGEVLDDSIEALIRHAMAKDPAQRHASAVAFRYELNTVMDMLKLSRRRHRSTHARESTLGVLFDQSTLPQAVMTAEGQITIANGAFAKLVACEQAEGQAVGDTALIATVPDLHDHLRAACEHQRPIEVRAHVELDDGAPLDLSLWLVPFAGEQVHVLVRYVQRMRMRRPSRIKQPAAG